MPSNGDANLQRLKQAGLIMQDSLPEPFVRLVDGLTPHEVDMLVAMAKRLEAADAWPGLEPATPGQLPPFTTYIVF